MNNIEYAPGLYLVATPIGNLGDISPRAKHILEIADVISCEDTRQMKKLLQLIDIDFSGRDLVSIHDHNEREKSKDLVSKMKDGKIVAYASDAGMPAISDPGSYLVRNAHDANINVSCIPGPSAVVTSVALSGYETTAFSFIGFFPRASKEQSQVLASIKDSKSITVFFESPQRLSNTLKLMSQVLGTERKATLCRELTKKFEEVVSSDLGGLVSRFKGETKGECVIVIGPSDSDPESIDISKIENSVASMKEAGMSSKDVTEIIVELTGVSKNTVKDIYTSS